MNKKSAFTYFKKIKIYLVFFCMLLLMACKQTPKETAYIKVNNRESITFESTSKLEDLSIVLENQPDISILGDWSKIGDSVSFVPVLPFTIGQTYNIKNQGEVIYIFGIEREAIKSTTELLAIYPTSDSVPENLLKMYLVFSKPMQKIGNSLDYITVYDNTINKEVSVFLELQTELWNKDHTVLTLWLDPGRVKTDLIPNKKLGLPLINTHKYTILIDSTWKDANGEFITKPNSKTLIVGARDNGKPDPKKWFITIPNKGTKDGLVINFKESMDYFLAMECFNIMDAENNKISGRFSLVNNERELHFYPSQGWKKGRYSILIEPRLEDLSGNNLNHVFDTDLNAVKTEKESPNIKPISFAIN